MMASPMAGLAFSNASLGLVHAMTEHPTKPDSRDNAVGQPAREKFLGLSLESTRKSYYPQLKKQLEMVKGNERRLQLLIDSLPARISFVDYGKGYFIDRFSSRPRGFTSISK